MKKRYIAHWFLGSSSGDSMRSDTVDGLINFVTSRIKGTCDPAYIANVIQTEMKL